jgi:hypothetical protein
MKLPSVAVAAGNVVNLNRFPGAPGALGEVF